MKRSREARIARRLDPDAPSLVRALAIAGCAAIVCAAFAFVLIAGLMPADVTPKPAASAAGPEPVSGGQAADPMAELLRAIEAHDVGRTAAVAERLPAGVLDRPEGGKTPLMHAATLGNADMVRVLLARGADPNARGASQRTALQYAVERNRIEAARELLEAGADIDAYDNTRLTPLIMAADRGHTELAILLIDRGADVNLVHAQGWTALIDAARTGNARLVDRLLSRGAKTDARLPKGQTARDLAVQAGHAEVVRLLDHPQRNRPGEPLSAGSER